MEWQLRSAYYIYNGEAQEFLLFIIIIILHFFFYFALMSSECDYSWHVHVSIKWIIFHTGWSRCV